MDNMIMMDLLEQQISHSYFKCTILQIGRGFDWLICKNVTSIGESIQIMVVLDSPIFVN